MDALGKIKDNFWLYFSEYFHNGKKTTLVLCSSATALYVAYLVKKYLDERKYFEKMNLPGPKPWPLLGNLGGIMRDGIHEYDVKQVRTYGKTFGYFEGSFPVIITTDAKLIKSYLIKDFNSFVNRRVYYNCI
jgi:hypothetical protein